MRIKIHRGQNQIGGSIIEVSSDSTKIILDAGSELDEKVTVTPLIEGLFSGKPTYNAAFISHYHGDHLGLCDKILQEIPVYIGKSAGEVTNAARKFMGKPEYTFSGYYESESPFTVGDLVITPYLCDHSAFDAYMFHVECQGKTLLYTGDFRSHGRKSFLPLLDKLSPVDILITEGTTLSRRPSRMVSEKDLEEKAVQLISQTNGPVFVYMAATNIDRLVTAYRAARRTNRIFLQDLYLAAVSTAAGGKIPKPTAFQDVRVFLTNGNPDSYEQLQLYGDSRIGKQGIAKSRFVMCVRSSMRGYLEKLAYMLCFEDGLLIYSMWEGYKDNENMKRFLDFMEERGVRVVLLHTSGHADSATIEALICKVQPKAIIPVHTTNASWFARYPDIRVLKEQDISL
ncbi:Ribonuclease J [bioreactor metagenome]|uniref:Ribonuclease J n=1 Tax=bioreactor metagenome TaxID=1076179 RepID=A0A644XPD7_9ZZZZ